MKLPVVDGRECVPVRLLPFLTRGQTLSADNAAQVFSWRHPFGAVRRWAKETHQLHPDGSHSALQPRDWDEVVERIAVLERELKERETFAGQLAHEWDLRSVELLPAGVFIWRDELEAEYARMFGNQAFYVERPGIPDVTDELYRAALDNIIEPLPQLDVAAEAGDSGSLFDELADAADALMTRPGDGELTFDPLLSAEGRQKAFEGFEARMGASLAAAPKAVSRAVAHQELVLAELRKLGFDPVRLPPVPKGKSSEAKQAVKKASKLTGAVLNKAWQGLLDDGRIKYA